MMALYILYCLAVVQLLVCASASNMTLKSIHVLFRHGDRTQGKYPEESYPTDPYKNNPFYPIGFRGLTNKGKQRLYQLGSFLRERYDDFLGDYYWAPDVKLISTDTIRTKMSLSIVLASLYPPKGEQVWNKNLNWQPIATDYITKEEEPHFLYYNCPVYKAEIQRMRKALSYQRELTRFSGLFKELSYYTGTQVKDTEFVYYLLFTLVSQRSMNLTLPEWTKPYFPNGPLLDAALLEYDFMSYNDKMKRLNGGMTLNKILKDVSFVMNETEGEKPKLYLYSAHESNIAGVLKTLNLWKRAVPEFTSGIIFEIYQDKSEYFIKVLYYKGIPSEYEERQIPGCSMLCPYEEFLKITKDFIPVDVKKECFGLNHKTYRFKKNAPR